LNYVTDTHSLVWYFTDDQHLSKKALKSFESTVKEGQIIVPAVVFGRDTFYSQERPDTPWFYGDRRQNRGAGQL
jgi:PIN domain nuclease of toxin-antitoxin system